LKLLSSILAFPWKDYKYMFTISTLSSCFISMILRLVTKFNLLSSYVGLNKENALFFFQNWIIIIILLVQFKKQWNNIVIEFSLFTHQAPLIGLTLTNFSTVIFILKIFVCYNNFEWVERNREKVPTFWSFHTMIYDFWFFYKFYCRRYFGNARPANFVLKDYSLMGIFRFFFFDICLL
jgi:hypothetical protein